MQQQEIQYLIKKYNAGTCSDYEKGLVEDWYLQFELTGLNALTDQERAADLDAVWGRVSADTIKIKQIKVWYRLAAASVVLLFLSVGIYYATHKNSDQEQIIQAITHNLKPGRNNAILTLGNGKQIVLTGAVNGQIASQNSTVITKTADGKVVYQSASTIAKGNIDYNSMSTPLGGTYDLTLSDGTKVTLDAASSIRYPVIFSGNERKVEITGQAYFEVAHNKAKPFRVTCNGQTVEVLGTHFNINAYADEGAICTTLLEGSVKVTKNGQAAMLIPGQQSVITPNSAAIVVKNADTETAVAWKNGLFRFKRANLQTVMRQFARWYNVEVVYKGGVPDAAITGKVLRTANAAQILKIVSNLGINFKMEDKKIVIIKE